MKKSRISTKPRRVGVMMSTAVLATTALIGALSYPVGGGSQPVQSERLQKQVGQPEVATVSISDNQPLSEAHMVPQSSSVDLFAFLQALGNILFPAPILPSAPAPSVGQAADPQATNNFEASGSGASVGVENQPAGAENGADQSISNPLPQQPSFPMALRGDVVDVAGEAVYVCATGNGLGISHVGATLSHGASGESTRAESAQLCVTAMRVAGAVVIANGSRSGLLTTPRIIESAGRYECSPAAQNVLRCTGLDGSLFTLWDVAK